MRRLRVIFKPMGTVLLQPSDKDVVYKFDGDGSEEFVELIKLLTDFVNQRIK